MRKARCRRLRARVVFRLCYRDAQHERSGTSLSGVVFFFSRGRPQPHRGMRLAVNAPSAATAAANRKRAVKRVITTSLPTARRVLQQRLPVASGIIANTSAPNSAAPAAPPVERASETVAVAAASRVRPATVWTTTWLTGITVPRPSPTENPAR